MRQFAVFVSLILVASQISIAEAQRKPLSLGRLDPEYKAGRTQVDKALEKRMEARVLALSKRVNVPARELSDFFQGMTENGRTMSASSVKAWKSLINSTQVSNSNRGATVKDFMEADILADMVGSFIRVRNSKLLGEFEISEMDLMNIHTGWTVQQKGNFGKVLRRTAAIAKSSKTLTANQAFEKALKENGLLEKFRKFCQKG